MNWSRADGPGPADVYVDKIRHTAGIETDEEGTKAYATTVAAMAGKSAEPLPGIIINRPFVCFIRAGMNGLILFAGVVNNSGTTYHLSV